MIFKNIISLNSWMCTSSSSQLSSTSSPSSSTSSIDSNGNDIRVWEPRKVKVKVHHTDGDVKTLTIDGTNYQTLFDQLAKFTGLPIKNVFSCKIIGSRNSYYPDNNQLTVINRRFRRYNHIPLETINSISDEEIFVNTSDSFILMIYHKLTDRIMIQFALIDETIYMDAIGNPDYCDRKVNQIQFNYSKRDRIVQLKALMDDKDLKSKLIKRYKKQSIEKRSQSYQRFIDYAQDFTTFQLDLNDKSQQLDNN
ncbi:uncharacterized protein LOC128395202 [Panonychus citri]|uniref:uncharacterized protein LOC128395202 n=1 Tax=Panonychus citri TaxID=50023 RepID=UPI0023076174|nr:uncharacterized protein LOC128395202 [Panonychus citri]